MVYVWMTILFLAFGAVVTVLCMWAGQAFAKDMGYDDPNISEEARNHKKLITAIFASGYINRSR